ncbi:hypothetical protein KPK_3333 [Klebsiella variicola]|uniref:Uncharacterized protein n=1 Tax=Klebsiella variicola (strain 342) TaxID=507522 RepID=B5XSF8_KLEV3|nr:hypothetical protein KPK_3333 [Klebsiella variicola]
MRHERARDGACGTQPGGLAKEVNVHAADYGWLALAAKYSILSKNT